MSLPPRPNFIPQNGYPSSSQVPSTGFALQSTLNNPYAQTYSSHYAQAYMQNYASQPFATPEGYTYSSTYGSATPLQSQPNDNAPKDRFSFQAANSTWYQPGNNRCTYKNCTFTGSAKSLEIHRMDRHLIYPPGWEKRNKARDWDADPSLKGKPIPIQGTKIVLDTPDAVDAWVAERKKRWPTANRVEDKKRKLEEATARGQLTAEELGLFSKKRRLEGPDNTRGRGNRGRGRGRGRVNVRGGLNAGYRGNMVKDGQMDNGNGSRVPQERKPLPVNSSDSKSSDESDDDGEPEVASSKINTIQPLETDDPKPTTSQSLKPPNNRQTPIRQPKGPPPNPFAPKASLLRSLLLPEIRMTVSNLSQAIRFIVDNDFLRDVEIRPGESNEKLIEVIGSESNGGANDQLSQ